VDSDSESIDWDGSPSKSSTIYPQVGRRKPVELSLPLPERVVTIYLETLTAFNSEANILAAMGIRALVEAVCSEKGCSGKNLEKRIDQLAEKDVITKAQANFLHLTRLMGNLAAHEMEEPNAHDLRAALDLTEGMLRAVYELPRHAEQLKKRYEKQERSAESI
jgi:hypothetical protein